MNRRRWLKDTIADVEAPGLWAGKVVSEVVPASDFWEAEPEHQDYLEGIGYTCHFVRLGWLDDFNEMMVRCGYEWTGHPGMDDGRLVSLHGRAGNTPASKVVIVIDEEPPHRIGVRGQVNEKVFKFVNHETWTEVSTEPGSKSFAITDTMTNFADYEHEYQILYHGNFGAPLLEAGSEFVASVKTVAPFNDDAAKDIDTWTTYLEPIKDYGEQVYNVIPSYRMSMPTDARS